MPTPKDLSESAARRRQEADAAREAARAAKALKAARRAENERNRQAKAAAKAEQQRRLALPVHERLAASAARIDAKWTLPESTVSAEEVRAAQRAAITRVEVVEVIREITVEVPAPPLPAGSYTECEVCVGRGMHDRYGQVPAATEQLRLVDGAGQEVTVIDTCPTHVPYVQATARRRGFRALAGDSDRAR
ncbi:hypothetical protein [Planomonospora sp. ID82291]|uniref:hypothetical protein n=1 Tax=Planomonospora sp. ID82291 TaxID=2738136 RepID=UPI0018C405CB|nr:hypothetical protein [Planomonospora sp. ID82291]MBG0819072.1 hypothetical protein [Planomonospora sp. ID82291]